MLDSISPTTAPAGFDQGPITAQAPFLAHRSPEDPCDAPEVRLLLAVLHDALETYQRGLRTSACRELQAFREVDRWFRSDDYDWPFSFENICSTLGVDAGHVRDGLNRLRRSVALDRTVKKKRMLARGGLATRRPRSVALAK